MKKEKKVWAISLIAFWWLAPNQTNAQQDSVKTTELHEVVVTATKFPKSQSETGKVVTVIDEAQLQRSSGKDVSQLLNEQVGIVINGANGNLGKDKSVFLRGAGSQYTLIVVDGIPVNDPSGAGGAFDLRLLPIDQIERIEILKGSQSTLYGTDAIAGVINIITKKKGDKKLSGNATASYGTYNTLKANAGVSGSISLLDYHVSYTRFQTDGISEATDVTGNNNFDKDEFDQNAFQLNLSVRPNKKLAFNPFIRYTNFDGRYDGGAFLDDKSAFYTSNLLNAGISGQYALTNSTLHFQYSRSQTERNYESSFGTYPYKGIFDHADFFVNSQLSNRLQLLGGINFQQLGMEDEKATKKDPSITITSPYASFFVKNLSGFSAEVGGRYNYHTQFGNTFTYSINPTYLIDNKIKIFANYSTGFKAPTLNELYGEFGANDQLKPQESKSGETGIQYITQSGKIDLRVTAFDRRITNAIIYSNTGYINLNEQHDLGIEIEPSIRFKEKLTLRAFYAYVEGRVTTKSDVSRDTTFNNLFRRPKHSIGVNLGYQVTKKFFASVNLKTFGDRNDLFYSFDPVTFESRTEIVRLDAYQLVDVYMEYSINNAMKCFVDARNLFNQHYIESYGFNTMRFNITSGLTLKL